MNKKRSNETVIKDVKNKSGGQIVAFRWGRYGCVSSLGGRIHSPILQRMAGIDRPRQPEA